jgi:hypothetical protein
MSHRPMTNTSSLKIAAAYCSMTHSPGKIEFNRPYFIMSFRKQIHTKQFNKNGFHTLQGTMSHRPLTNASSLEITAAYCTVIY